MKKILLGLMCTAVVIGFQLPTNKIILASSLEIKQEFSLASEKFAEEAKKEAEEKPVDSKTESTKPTKKKY